MHCDVCWGMGVVLRTSFPSGEPQPRPCTACGGSGLAHCCEGERPDRMRPAEPRKPGREAEA
jgi:hypothetical protein